MRDDLHAGIGLAIGANSSPVKRSCTSQWPFQVMISTSVFVCTYLREILVGDAGARAAAPRTFDHLHGVGRGAADVALGLHFGRRVDVGDHRHAGIGFAQRAHSAPVIEAASEQPARGSGISTVLSGLSSFEVSAMKCTPPCTMILASVFAASGELQPVAEDVAHAMEDLRRHVVMRQDNGVPRALEFVDGLDVRGEARPLERRDDPRDALVKMRGRARHLRRIGEVGQKLWEQTPAVRFCRGAQCSGRSCLVGL